MRIKNRTIGIWGYGLVGKAAAQFLQRHGAKIVIYDDNTIDCPFEQCSSLKQLLEQTNAILPSPGIDTRKYRDRYKGKWLTELDLFQQFFKKKIIAITGSVGKTTITHMLTALLAHEGWRVKAAGNIGIPCLELIDHQPELDAAILEVSSFQLEYCQSFAPDLAIWTNFSPNHLDRHGSLEQYFQAKYNLIAHQTASEQAILPFEIKSAIEQCKPQCRCIYVHQTERPTIALSGFADNAVIIEKALELLAVPYHPIAIKPLEHRLEKVATINGISFYNDSKSTTPASTLAAVQQLKKPDKPMVLFLGGLSKGIKRLELIQQLKDYNIIVICFGQEAEQLHSWCTQHSIPSLKRTTLTDAFSSITHIASAIVLFSPGGSSFDEFKNYEERGNRFKELVFSYHDFSH